MAEPIHADFHNQEGLSATDPNQIYDTLSGRGVVSGGEVHDAAEPFELQVFATRVFFAHSNAGVNGGTTDDGSVDTGATLTRGGATVDLREYVTDFLPRKVLICTPRDPTAGNAAEGLYHIVAGEPANPEPSGTTGREAAQPALPDLRDGSYDGVAAADLVPVAGAWIGANADDITENDVWDRRHSPDIRTRQVIAGQVAAETIIDPAGTTHTSELADAADVRTDAEITDIAAQQVANYDHYTDTDARAAVEGDSDVTELSGALGTDGQLIFSNGTTPYWASPPAGWGDPFDQNLNTTDSPTLAGLTVGDETITGSITWPDGTVTTTSPAASAGAVAVLEDLGDVSAGEYANRPAPSASGDYYVTLRNGIFYDPVTNDPPAWETVAHHALNIGPDELGFDPVTNDELGVHTADGDAHHAPPTTDEIITSVETTDTLAVNISGDSATVGGVPAEGFVRGDGVDAGPQIIDVSGHEFVVLDTRLGTTNVLWYDPASSNLYAGTPGVPLKLRGELDAGGQNVTGAELVTASSMLAGGSAVLTESDESSLAVAHADSADTAANATEADRLASAAHWREHSWGLEVFPTATAQDAIDYAGANALARVEFPSGSFGSPSLTASHEGLSIVGVGGAKAPARRTLFSGSVSIDADGVELDGVAVDADNTDYGVVISAGQCTVRDCEVFGATTAGIRAGGSGHHITGTTFGATDGGDRLQLSSFSSDCTVIGNQQLAGYVYNAGNGNVYQGLNS